MMAVPNIEKGHDHYEQICGCFRKGALAIARNNRSLESAHKYGILFWILGEEQANKVSNRPEVFDDPEFAYWLLRVGFSAESEWTSLINDNLRLFTSWLFVKINR